MLQFNFINACYPDYLTDHHTRENEQLISTYYSPCMSIKEYALDVCEEVFTGSDYQELWKELPECDHEARTMILQLVEEEMAAYCYLFNLEIEDEDEIYLYAYFSW